MLNIIYTYIYIYIYKCPHDEHKILPGSKPANAQDLSSTRSDWVGHWDPFSFLNSFWHRRLQ